MRLVLAVVAIGAAIGAADARAQQCFPECRDGFTCEAGQCVAEKKADPQANQCFPECRSGYRCDGGQCVAEPATGPDVVQPAPDEPRGPPAMELSAGAFYLSLFGVDEKAIDELEPGEVSLGGRLLTFAGRAMFRRGHSRNWLALDLGGAFVRRSKADEDGNGGQSGDASGFMIAGTYLWRVPIRPGGYDLLVDEQVSVDVGVGAHAMAVEGFDAGAQIEIGLSLWWLQIRALATHGIRSRLGVNLGTHARVAF